MRPRIPPIWIKTGLLLGLAALLVAGFLGGDLVFRWMKTRSLRFTKLTEWFQNGSAHPDWAVHAGERCGQAPFVMPTDGYIGFLWDDSFQLGHRHQGLDIFGPQETGVTPVVAAAAGYLTRLPDWKSTLAIRIPEDPLQPGRQIWTYYTHIASPDGKAFIVADFPPGTSEVYVEAGTLLGYQGNYSGDPNNPTGVHLHFSIVRDDGHGWLAGELDIRNTLDPSAYLGLNVNANTNRGDVPQCEP